MIKKYQITNNTPLINNIKKDMFSLPTRDRPLMTGK